VHGLSLSAGRPLRGSEKPASSSVTTATRTKPRSIRSVQASVSGQREANERGLVDQPGTVLLGAQRHARTITDGSARSAWASAKRCRSLSVSFLEPASWRRRLADVFRAGDPECASAGVEMAQVDLGKVASELIRVEAVCTARRLGGEGILRRAAAVLDRLSLVPLSPEIIELATGAHTRPATGNGRDLPGYGPHDAMTSGSYLSTTTIYTPPRKPTISTRSHCSEPVRLSRAKLRADALSDFLDTWEPNMVRSPSTSWRPHRDQRRRRHPPAGRRIAAVDSRRLLLSPWSWRP